jgi:hypothetical protein
VFLFVFASNWVFVTEDEVNLTSGQLRSRGDPAGAYLGTRTREVRTKHNDPRCRVRELLATGLETIFKKLEVTTTTIATLLVFDFILNDKVLVLEVNGVREGGGDSVMGRLGLCNQTLVAFNDDCVWVFNLPLPYVAKSLAANRCLFGSFGGCPAVSPVVCELFDERSLDGCGLGKDSEHGAGELTWQRTYLEDRFVFLC